MADAVQPLGFKPPLFAGESPGFDEQQAWFECLQDF